jgi:predicted NBD/HSP70 family sugar kinase
MPYDQRMTAAKPSLALLREMSDEAVLRALMDRPRLTRAELAVLTGLSKPTTGDAIRRLEAAGLVHDTGERTSGRGGVGTYYALADDVGVALAVSIAPDGVTAEVLDAAGAVLNRVVEPVQRPATAGAVTKALRRVAKRALDKRVAGAAAVSAADPVDKSTGELVHLPDSPFLLGAMSPAATLAPLLDGPVIVDNDVNWAARAELGARSPADDFVYLYLGEGLGCAVVTDGAVRRGNRGLVGEIAHVVVPGPDGRPMPLIGVFGELGLRHVGSTAVDVDRLVSGLRGADGSRLARDLAVAISAVLDAAIAFADPAFVVVGGPWGPSLVTPLRMAIGEHARTISVEEPLHTDDPSLSGARAAAVDALRSEVIARSRIVQS